MSILIITYQLSVHCQSLDALLPEKSNNLDITDEMEVVHLHNYEETRGARGERNEIYDGEDERDEGPGGMRCAQQ